MTTCKTWPLTIRTVWKKITITVLLPPKWLYVFLNIVFIAFVFVRIEMYKWQLPSSPYSKSTMRMTLALFVILVLSLCVRLFFPLSFRDSALMYHLVFTFIIFVFIPGLMFFGNDKLINYAGYLLDLKGCRVGPLDQ